ncbi:MAG: ADP-ribosylglycohydrolase family protein [Acidobacteria bacterium]|nr:ADP-ribosylglycohydrolase family protein [Acidobacteriota bacterium]
MNLTTRILPALALLGVLTASNTFAAGAQHRLSRAELLDRIRGGWAGQMIGVSYGAPTEFKSNGKINEGPILWEPDRVSNAIDQDDLYVEMTFAKVMDDKGLDATSADFGNAFRDSEYELWHANAAARRVLGLGIKGPLSGHPRHIIHANDIDFQIEADFIGLMCPGLPRLSNQFCDRVGRVMNYGDGLYGGMFVCGMYSAAFFDSDPRSVVRAGLACIPQQSEYARLISDLLAWSAQNPNDWRAVWKLVEDKWNKNDPCPDGAGTPFNIDAKLNGA